MPKQSKDNFACDRDGRLCESPHGVSLFNKSPSHTTLRQVFEADGAALFLDRYGSSSVLDQVTCKNTFTEDYFNNYIPLIVQRYLVQSH